MKKQHQAIEEDHFSLQYSLKLLCNIFKTGTTFFTKEKTALYIKIFDEIQSDRVAIILCLNGLLLLLNDDSVMQDFKELEGERMLHHLQLYF